MDINKIYQSMINNFSNFSFTDFTNLLSIIGFFISVYVYFDLKRLKKFYLFKGRSPDLCKQLSNHSSKINDYLGDFNNNIPNIDKELALAVITLKSIKRKTSGFIKQSISLLQKKINSYKSKEKSESVLREIYIDMIQINEQIRDLMKDQNWELK
jgi:hypothetical protein